MPFNHQARKHRPALCRAAGTWGCDAGWQAPGLGLREHLHNPHGTSRGCMLHGLLGQLVCKHTTAELCTTVSVNALFRNAALLCSPFRHQYFILTNNARFEFVIEFESYTLMNTGSLQDMQATSHLRTLITHAATTAVSLIRLNMLHSYGLHNPRDLNLAQRSQLKGRRQPGFMVLGLWGFDPNPGHKLKA